MDQPVPDSDKRRRRLPGVPTWLPGAVVGAILALVGAAALVWVVGRLRGLLVLLLISLFVSFALEPAVHFLTRRGWRRRAATAVVFLATFLAVAGFTASIVPLLVSQVSALARAAPDYLDEVQSFLAGYDLDVSLAGLRETFQSAGSFLQAYAADLPGRVVGLGTALLGAVFQLVTVGLFSYYLVADGPKLRRTVLSVLPPDRQREVLYIY
ncbi:MAG: AI-2E family transporter, partial [Acidimicrobiia bacterium]